MVRGSDLEEGPSEGLPIWREHVGDPALASNRTRRVDFALFMVEALTDERLVQQAPAIVVVRSVFALGSRGEGIHSGVSGGQGPILGSRFSGAPGSPGVSGHRATGSLPVA